MAIYFYSQLIFLDVPASDGLDPNNPSGIVVQRKKRRVLIDMHGLTPHSIFPHACEPVSIMMDL
jgi:hypothetical protein